MPTVNNAFHKDRPIRVFNNGREEKPMKLEATSTFPIMIVGVLKDAPIDCDEFRDFYEKFTEYIVPYSTGMCSVPNFGDIFCGIDKPRALLWLHHSANKPALDYALKKGWVRYKKEPRVIEVGEDEKVTLYWKYSFTSYTSDSIERIDIE